MFFKLKSDVMFRNYESFGYLTDNRNFGYIESNNQSDIGDKIVSQSGALFLSVLSREPQTLDDLTIKINKEFTDVDIEIIKKDAKEFYIILSKEGFIISGETLQECNENDTKFSYKTLESKIKNNVVSLTIVNNEKSTQDFFNEYFKGKPQLTNIHIEITSKCNERCVHCYIPHDYKVSEIDPNL
ncbi:MAG: radical SAM protein, partial [Treponema sp.]|nr:radical SAM protein [Treponema sp.]